MFAWTCNSFFATFLSAQSYLALRQSIEISLKNRKLLRYLRDKFLKALLFRIASSSASAILIELIFHGQFRDWTVASETLRLLKRRFANMDSDFDTLIDSH